MDYSIDGFWLPRLGNGVPPKLKLREGWSAGGNTIEGFVEPPVVLASETEFGDARIDEARVILIAAPGAVGKTTFARQVCALTGAVLVDLSRTGAIGDNFLSGGLHKVGAYEAFCNGDLGVMIDGLDEALLKTSSEGLVDFLKDVLEMASTHCRPIFISGRTGSINEAWLILADQGYTAPVVQIDYFGDVQAKELARGALKRILLEDSSRKRPFTTADEEAVGLLLEKLKSATAADEKRFVGYAPVLEAIAKQVAAYANPQELVGRLNKEETVDVRQVVEDILEREKYKVEQLTLSDPGLRGHLYTPGEQVARLVRRLFGAELQLPLPAMSNEDRTTYETHMQRWLGEHPFLDGSAGRPSSAVFGGYLAVKALERPESERSAREALGRQGALPNPFLSMFYLPDDWEGADQFKFLDLADVPLVHASLVARVPASDRVSLEIDGVEDEDEVDVQITWKSDGFKSDRVLSARVSSSGLLAFGGRIANVHVDAEGLEVELGNGVDAVLFAPVEISAKALLLNASSLTVEPPNARRTRNGADAGEEDEASQDATSRANLASRVQITTNGLPAIRVMPGAALSVAWPGSKGYPWTDYSTSATQPPPPEFAEAYGRLRKIVMPFKSDKYGTLAKYKKFVDHRRRTKGSGQKVRDHLFEAGVISVLDYRFYQLNPVRLTEVTGLTRDRIRNGDSVDLTVEFLRAALARD
ncbi:hypothetical protein MesoLjLc_17930 [Mesorhizobium sp. L-8-10]|uniref:hypothetical protein n=1 Tax=Mesorhizobium sp. L-8-10 TaxID=2744523 RepID=UPI00192685A4|nr:hypothetical protein [Mesorhizobium sp. L-8-10]BCH29863.1 hypothetical protein MesoLjLc_17930 [Mesorhizobium sp. L-8-10]